MCMWVAIIHKSMLAYLIMTMKMTIMMSSKENNRILNRDITNSKSNHSLNQRDIVIQIPMKHNSRNVIVILSIERLVTLPSNN